MHFVPKSNKPDKCRFKIIFLIVLLMNFLFSVGFQPVSAVAYEIPAGVDLELQASVQSQIEGQMDKIMQRVDKDMNAAMNPIIPQINTLVSNRTKDMGPRINEMGISLIQPSLKSHVEDQTQMIGTEVNGIISDLLRGFDFRSDPSAMIRSKLISELPRLKKEAIERANQEQIKDMEVVKPQVEAMVQQEMDALIPEIQDMVLKALKASVPQTQKAVDEDIDRLIADIQKSLPEEQRQLISQMRPQFESAVRPVISEELFEAVAVKLDQRVVDGLKKDTLSNIRAIMVPMNQYCTDYATDYAKSLLPSQVDQIGIRAQIESLIEETATENISVFEDRIMADNEQIFSKQSEAINEQMHSFVKSQVLAILNSGSANAVKPVPPVNNTPSSSSVGVFLDGRQLSFDVPPMISQGRTLVPLRVIFESLGATVNWDPATQSITAIRGTDQITLQADKVQAVKNGQPITLDVPATIVNGRTMVPARFVSESFGATVNWDASTQTVNISTL